MYRTIFFGNYRNGIHLLTLPGVFVVFFFLHLSKIFGFYVTASNNLYISI